MAKTAAKAKVQVLMSTLNENPSSHLLMANQLSGNEIILARATSNKSIRLQDFQKALNCYNIVITLFVYLNMIKTLTSVGNSKAVILPSEMVKKYKLEKVVIEETDDGILIRSAVQNTNFQKAIEKLRKNKAALYKRIESQANDPETINYYAKSANNFSDVDLDILEE